MKFGIIGAMQEEIELLVKSMSNVSVSSHADMKFYSGKSNEKEVAIVKCGVGKVNAAVCAQILINNFNVNSIIFTGVAGAVDKVLEVGDVVISSDSVQYDVDASALGFDPGQICFTDLKYFKADENLVNDVLKASKKLKIKCVKGRVLTGDRFITDSKELEKLKETFGGICIEMEGAAIGHVCSINKVPFVIIRSISDKANHSASIDFEKFLKKASLVSSSIVHEILKNEP
tara:strand:- start:21226 stop:21918 length:693 start_codon:yes stop_codon:yes gene_type:complete